VRHHWISVAIKRARTFDRSFIGRAESAESGREMQKLQKRFTTALSMFMTLVLSFALVGCNVFPFLQNNPAQQATQSSITTGEIEAIHEPKFGGSYLDITIEEFNNLGFEYGDSVDVTFSNGYKLSDIPYYNGYYTKTNEPLVVAYPG